MKKILYLVFAGLGAAASAGAQSLPLACTEVGTQLEYADYDSRGALTGYTQTVVAASESGPDGLIVETRTALLDADRRPVEPDKGGDALQTGRLVVSAEGICLRPDDWLDMVSGDDWKASVECRGDKYLIPAVLQAGQLLPELAMTLHIRTENGFKTQVSIRISDRRVVAQETTTVPAGTYETVCLTETVHVKWSVVGAAAQIRTWYAPGVGSVRVEKRNKRGKFESRSELISVLRPQR